MKKISTRRSTQRCGFTLVELLVVIGIIAILAAVVMSIGGTVIRMAKKAKAQNTATQIQTSALAYYTEYSVYPTPSGAGTGDYMLNDADAASGGAAGAATWGQLIECLSGNISPATGAPLTPAAFSNTRSIAFITLKASDVATGAHQDAPLNPLPPVTNGSGLYFNIAFDTGYSGLLGTGDATNGSAAWLPGFATVTSNAAPPTSGTNGGSSTAGVAVWANCNAITTANSSNWYVHTY